MTVDIAQQRKQAETEQRIVSLADGFGLVTDEEIDEVDSKVAALTASPDNANPFVPWDNPDIPFECSCGQIIYADTPHGHDYEEETGRAIPNQASYPVTFRSVPEPADDEYEQEYEIVHGDD